MVDQEQQAVGTSFSSDCQIEGTFSTVQWSLEASPLLSNGEYQTDNTGMLTIDDVQPHNEGLYKCSANDGSLVGATQINLTVLGKNFDSYASIGYTVYGCTCICDVIVYSLCIYESVCISSVCARSKVGVSQKMKVHWVHFSTFKHCLLVYYFKVNVKFLHCKVHNTCTFTMDGW